MQWTQHAIERIKTSPFKVEWVKKLFKTASKTQLSRRIESWKFKRYGLKQTNVTYYRKTLEILYTVSEETNTVITFTVKDRETKQVWGKDGFSPSSM